MSVFSTISVIISVLCFVWLIGLGVFVLVRSIVLKVKSKKQMKQDLDEHKKKSKQSDDNDYEDDFRD